jgi:hypothetical protein
LISNVIFQHGLPEPSAFPSGYDKLKGKGIALAAETTAMKGNIGVIAEAIATLDKKAAVALVEKREMWSTISVSTSFLRI